MSAFPAGSAAESYDKEFLDCKPHLPYPKPPYRKRKKRLRKKLHGNYWFMFSIPFSFTIPYGWHTQETQARKSVFDGVQP